MAASIKFRSEIVTLPASLEKLQAEYASEAITGSTNSSNRWDSYWKFAVGQLGRETYIAGTAFSSPFVEEEKEAASDARELALAIAAFKVRPLSYIPFSKFTDHFDALRWSQSHQVPPIAKLEQSLSCDLFKTN